MTIHPVNYNDICSLLIDVHEIPISMHMIHLMLAQGHVSEHVNGNRVDFN